MKLAAYIITVDSGFAPHPFGRYCTLACCKPTIRRTAEPGDIVIACAASSAARPRHLVYAMRVKEVIPYQKYWRIARFATRKPSKKTAVRRRGDNIWHQDRAGKWHVCAGACHDQSHCERDTGGVNALVATDFFYFGRSAIRIPVRFRDCSLKPKATRTLVIGRGSTASGMGFQRLPRGRGGSTTRPISRKTGVASK